MTIERRDARGEAPQVTDSGQIRGLAIPFNSWTLIGDRQGEFRERVAPGAVTKTIGEADVVYLDNHDPAKPIARKSAGTLALSVTARGLQYLAQPADTSYARDLVENVRAGNIKGNSFGFEVVKEHWGWGDDGIQERTLLELKLPEISACTFPAYSDTDIGMRDAYRVAMEARDRFYERAGKEPYGDVAYADPGYQSDKKKRYPVNTAEHVKAAWSYINKAKNAARYTSTQLAAIKSKIKAAAKKFGIKISSDRSFMNYDLRGYSPQFGLRDAKISQGPLNLSPSDSANKEDGDLYARISAALAHIMDGDHLAAIEALQGLLHEESGGRGAGAPETRDDPDGVEWAAMREAIAHLDSGDYDAARTALQGALPDDDDGYGLEPEGGDTVKHGAPAGAIVPAPRTVDRIYELVRMLPATAASNEALALLEPLLQSTPAEEERGNPKPETSTSGIAIDSDLGIEMQKRMKALKDSYRP